MSINDKILQQQVQLQRVVNGLIKNDLLPGLKGNYREVRSLLLDAEQITNQRQLNAITAKISKLITDNSLKVWQGVTSELNNFAEYELTYLANAMAASGYAVKGVTDSTNYIAKALMSLDGANPVTGTWADFVKANASGQADVINNQIKAAFVNNESIRDTVKRIKSATEGVISNRVENLARTGASHYSAMARKAFAEDNSDIIEKEYPIVTFDSRLSVTCASIGSKYSQKGWPVGKSPIGYPPYHYGCRTVIGFGLEGVDESPSKDVNEWFSKQPPEFQDDVLGVTRAEAFRKGVPLDKFTDATQRVITVEELAKNYQQI